MLRTLLCSLALASILAFSAGAQAAESPPTVTPDGAAPVPRAGQATRAHLLGLVEMYTVALYIDASMHELAGLASPDVAKALRIEIKYKEDLRRRVSIDWRRELIPALNPDATAQLRSTYAPLRYGDVVLVEYVPAKGTTLRVNKAVAVSDASHDLMVAFLDHWLGQRPVSDEIKQKLLGSS
jgi:hypothetical protein